MKICNKQNLRSSFPMTISFWIPKETNKITMNFFWDQEINWKQLQVEYSRNYRLKIITMCNICVQYNSCERWETCTQIGLRGKGRNWIPHLPSHLPFLCCQSCIYLGRHSAESYSANEILQHSTCETVFRIQITDCKEQKLNRGSHYIWLDCNKISHLLAWGQ